MDNNAFCSICGKPYHKCNSCSDSKMKPWRSIVDTINHYKIYLIIADYTNKKISKEKAKELLSACDISDYKTFVPEIKKVIGDITKTEKKQIKKVSKIESEIQQESVDNE